MSETVSFNDPHIRHYAGLTRPRNGLSGVTSASQRPPAVRRLGPISSQDGRHLARDRFAEVLDILDIGPENLAAARLAVRRNGTDLGSELAAAHPHMAHAIAVAVAAVLGLTREAIGSQDRIVDADRRRLGGTPRMVKTCDNALRTKLFLLPRLEDLDATAGFFSRHPELRAIARVTSPADVKFAFANQGSSERLERACLGLCARWPAYSARTVVTAGQALWFTFAAGLLVASFYSYPTVAAASLHAAAGLFFALSLAVRFAAALSTPPEDVDRPSISMARSSREDESLPLYSVLVALYKESAVVDRLVDSLRRLDWPASRLEIKLICEADDRQTLIAVKRAIAGLAQFDLVIVPPQEPRTKPKALNYALPLTAGEFLVLYDAEDDPDSGQLREAYERFRTAPAEVVGFQAPLVARNGDESWFAGLFALEYAGLFRRLLPWLASHDFPLPLGGTSNHFVALR